MSWNIMQEPWVCSDRCLLTKTLTFFQFHTYWKVKWTMFPKPDLDCPLLRIILSKSYLPVTMYTSWYIFINLKSSVKKFLRLLNRAMRKMKFCFSDYVFLTLTFVFLTLIFVFLTFLFVFPTLIFVFVTLIFVSSDFKFRFSDFNFCYSEFFRFTDFSSFSEFLLFHYFFVSDFFLVFFLSLSLHKLRSL